MVGASQISLHCNIIYSFHSFDFTRFMLVQFFHSRTDITSWLVEVEDPTVQVVQLRESQGDLKIRSNWFHSAMNLHCEIVSIVVMIIEFWQLSSVEGNILWMTI